MKWLGGRNIFTKMVWSVAVLLALVRLSTSTFDPELHAKYLQMPRDQFIQHFNAQNYSWKITYYLHLEHMELFGASIDDKPTGLEIKHHDPALYLQLPENFDARQKWCHCETINDIHDQGFCGSCWAIATATVASDRTCIALGLNVSLSEQDISCARPICSGGRANISFPFWRDHGLVTQKCKPYNIEEAQYCIEECKNQAMNYKNDKHFAKEVYGISKSEDDIRTELFTNGPLYASFVVYSDFIDYHSGVYKHQYGEIEGRHGVRVLGYGVENGDKYWLVANSWGRKYGENGFFKIQRYQDLLKFEDNMYSGLAKN